MRVFQPERKRIPKTESEFELPVPVSKLSYDSIMLGFAIETGCEALLPRTAFLARFSFCRWKRRSQNGAASHWNPAAESVAVWRMPEKASLERCDSSAEPALVFRTIKATRLSVANYNTTLSSESLETGTGSSNSLRSTIQSISSCTSWRIGPKSAHVRAIRDCAGT